MVSPADARSPSGGSQSYTVEGFDVYGNSRGDITFGTTSYSITPNGSCTANVCTATVSGDHTVKAQRGTKSATAILHVTPGGTTSIVISPSSSTVLAGTGVTYTAQAFDSIGNPIGDVTSETTFSIAPDGSCTANTCSATVAGAHTVTGTDGSFTDDASMTVSPEALDHIVVSPADATSIASGGSQSYTVEGFDVYGNSRGDITFGTTSYSITPNGSCTANVCTATVSGDHTVKAQRGTKSATAILHVTPGGNDLDPRSRRPRAPPRRHRVTYTAQAFDSIGNPIGDVTSETTFSIAPDGSCTANTCSATVPSPHGHGHRRVVHRRRQHDREPGGARPHRGQPGRRDDRLGRLPVLHGRRVRRLRQLPWRHHVRDHVVLDHAERLVHRERLHRHCLG